LVTNRTAKDTGLANLPLHQFAQNPPRPDNNAQTITTGHPTKDPG
jgi:hypothetical protein